MQGLCQSRGHQQRQQQRQRQKDCGPIPGFAIEREDECQQVHGQWQYPQKRNRRDVLSEVSSHREQQHGRCHRQHEPVEGRPPTGGLPGNDFGARRNHVRANSRCGHRNRKQCHRQHGIKGLPDSCDGRVVQQRLEQQRIAEQT